MIKMSFMVLFIALFTGCNNKVEKGNANTDIPPSYSHSDSNRLSGKYFCKINKISDRNSETIIEIDLVEFLSGDSAISAARALGEAEYEIDDSDDTLWFVPNDYFVLNKEIEKIEIPLSNNCEIEITFSDESENFELTTKSVNISRLKEHYNQTMVFIIEVSDGKVNSIKEQWIP